MSNLSREIRQFCSDHGLRLNTGLGQHFLIDESVLQTIVETADIQPTDHILEIGAGIGVLTRELLKRAANVTAIELDAYLIPPLLQYAAGNQTAQAQRTTEQSDFQYVNILKTSENPRHDQRTHDQRTHDQMTMEQSDFQYVNILKTGENPRHDHRLTIVCGNALTIPFPTEPYKIVANIPYHITSPLLRHAFLESPVQPTTMTLLIQREVAEKICDEKDRGLLTILVGLFGKPTLVRTVPPESFLPPPEVESAVLHIRCSNQPLADGKTMEEMFRLTKLAFSQKRKMLRNTIGATEDGLQRLRNAVIDPTRRPQTLSVEEWIRLAECP